MFKVKQKTKSQLEWNCKRLSIFRGFNVRHSMTYTDVHEFYQIYENEIKICIWDQIEHIQILETCTFIIFEADKLINWTAMVLFIN